jgi:3-methyladenine DNA glycosylase AlkC
MLTEEIPTTDQAVNPQLPKIHVHPPIFLHGVINYNKMIHSINEVAEAEQFYTKSLANNVIKITCLTPETYRSLIKHFKGTDVYYHTYQIKEERAYRVVIKYLHYFTEIEDIRQDLLQQGHVARNIVNVRHRITKEPLNVFY